jgi:hypothetical protein
MPIDAIRPRYDWLMNNEPEGHLDDLVDKLIALPGVDAETRILGLTYKDRSTVKRLADRRFQAINLDPVELAIGQTPFGLETIQRSLSNRACVNRLRDTHGSMGVLVARHIIEHAESAVRFVASVRGLLDDAGYLVLEFPDNARILRGVDHAFVWEEHFTYFTAESFRAFVARAGAEIVSLDRYSYRHEDALVAVLRFQPAPSQPLPAADAITQASLRRFASRFAPEREHWQARLSQFVSDGHRLAVFGGGHLAVKFINFMELAPWVDCVIDDHPFKKGLLMPGSRLPIEPSSVLRGRGIDICISTLSPESEVRVCRKLTDFFAANGQFIPAFDTPQES